MVCLPPACAWPRIWRKQDDSYPSGTFGAPEAARKKKQGHSPMSDISELEGRITQALDRIRLGVEALQAVPAPVAAPAPVAEPVPDNSGEIEDLRRSLEDERTANAQLEERVRAIRQRQDEKVSGMEAQLATQTDQLAAFEQECSKLRRLAEDMRTLNVALRDANMQGVGDAHLINKAMLTELETLRAARSAETAEAAAILSALDPLLAAPIEGGL